MECENCNKVTIRSEDNKKDLTTRMNRIIGQIPFLGFNTRKFRMNKYF